MTEPALRDTYLSWTRRAVPVLLVPLALTAALQAGAASPWWTDPAPSAGAMRYLFMAVGVASVMMGRTARTRDAALAPLTVAAVTSLSWRLVIYALAPAVVGAVLAFMTRELGDYYFMLLVTLVGLALLYPRFDQWVTWSAPVTDTAAAPEADTAAGPEAE